MFGQRKIRIDPASWEKLERCAAAGGYASTEEFVRHVLEREIDRVLGAGEQADQEAIRKRLEGLGYLG